MRLSESLSACDLKYGDILFEVYNPDHSSKFNKITKSGQQLSRLSLVRWNIGSADVIHAFLWTEHYSPSYVLNGDCYLVYRCTNEAVAAKAAQITVIWGRSAYNKRGALSSVFRSSVMGPAGHQAADKYRANASADNPKWKTQGFFCSQLVLAAFQAACASNNALFPGINAHAGRTSVRTLQHFLKKDSSNFIMKGYVMEK